MKRTLSYIAFTAILMIQNSFALDIQNGHIISHHVTTTGNPLQIKEISPKISANNENLIKQMLHQTIIHHFVMAKSNINLPEIAAPDDHIVGTLVNHIIISNHSPQPKIYTIQKTYCVYTTEAADMSCIEDETQIELLGKGHATEYSINELALYVDSTSIAINSKIVITSEEENQTSFVTGDDHFIQVKE